MTATNNPSATPIKVTHVASGDLWAGAEKQLFVLLKALRNQGTTVDAIILNPGKLADRLTEAGIDTHVLDESRQGSVALFRKVRNHLRETRPDVVHTHRTKENILAGLAAASLGIPSVRTQHGAQEHPASLMDLRRQVLIGADYLAGRWLQRRIVAVSPVLEQELSNRFGSEKVVRIENGLDVGSEPLTREWWQKPIWNIGIVGRQVPVKRVDLFLRAAKQLEVMEPDKGFHFSVIGDGPLLESHQALARELAFTNVMEFTGHIDNAEQAIATLDLLVICSDHEGLPMVALEAMRVGCVIVTHAIGALPSLLSVGHGGFIAPQHGVESFAITLQRAISDPGEIEKRGRFARKTLELHYSASHMAERYWRLYIADAGNCGLNARSGANETKTRESIELRND